VSPRNRRRRYSARISEREGEAPRALLVEGATGYPLAGVPEIDAGEKIEEEAKEGTAASGQ